MTVEEMREKLSDYCDSVGDCVSDCKIRQSELFCLAELENKDVPAAYKAVFGDDVFAEEKPAPEEWIPPLKFTAESAAEAIEKYAKASDVGLFECMEWVFECIRLMCRLPKGGEKE